MVLSTVAKLVVLRLTRSLFGLCEQRAETRPADLVTVRIGSAVETIREDILFTVR